MRNRKDLELKIAEKLKVLEPVKFKMLAEYYAQIRYPERFRDPLLRWKE